MIDSTDLMNSSDDTTSQDAPAPKKTGGVRTLRRAARSPATKANPVATEENQSVSGQQRTAYEDVKAVLIKAYPLALTMEELSTTTGNRWKQAEILLATNRGTLDHELIRDATYYPARYKINPDVVPIHNEAAPAQVEPSTETPGPQEVADQPKVTIIRKKKRTFEMPKAKVVQPVEKPVKKTRASGVFKDIVTYLVQSGEQLTVDEILQKTGVQSSKAVLTTTLSDRFAKKDIARNERTKPFRYYVPDELKGKYVTQYDIEGAAAAPAEAPVEESVLKAALTIAPAAERSEVVVVKPEEAPAVSPSGFDATINLDSLLTIRIDGQDVTLKPEWTRQLARMIRFFAE